MKVLYDYEAQDVDEISLKKGELVELIKEGLLLLKNVMSAILCSQMRAAGGQEKLVETKDFSQEHMFRRSQKA